MIMPNLITNKNMKYIITILSLISFSIPAKAISSYDKNFDLKYHSDYSAILETEGYLNHKIERARIRKKNPCNLQNVVGLSTHSSLLIAQGPQLIPVFTPSCKIRRV